MLAMEKSKILALAVSQSFGNGEVKSIGTDGE